MNAFGLGLSVRLSEAASIAGRTFVMAWLFGLSHDSPTQAASTQAAVTQAASTQAAVTQDVPPTVNQTQADKQFDVRVGIDGHYRVGRWVGIRVPGVDDHWAIETRDGDGVQVRYGRDRAADSSWTYVVPGSEAAPLIVMGEDRVIARKRFPISGSPSRGPSMIPLSMPWVFLFGDPLGIDQIGANELLGRDATVAVTRPKSTEEIPDSVLGFDGIDMMVIGAQGAPMLGALAPAQQTALADWVHGGGQVLLTLGESTDGLLKASPWLRAMLPIETIKTVSIEPSALETYASTQTPLQTFVGIELPKDRGEILIMGRTERRLSTPIAAKYNVGFGSILVIAADLETEPFASWPERLDLISRLTDSFLLPAEIDKERLIRSTAYNDLAGQLRASLDQFAIQRVFDFSVISLLLMALIAAIGPLDYFLVNRLLGKPLLGWLTFPIVVIAFAALLVSQSNVSPAVASAGVDGLTAEAISDDGSATQPTVRCNRVEIVDIDTIASVARGYSVNFLYSHDASRFDVEMVASETMRSLSSEVRRSLVAPFGYPGASFGGVQIAVEDSRLPAYTVAIDRADQRVLSSLVGLPLAPRSSKGFSHQLSFRPELGSAVRMQRRPGSELLQGELTNPLPLDLLDGRLVFRNWVYLLPTRLAAGQTIASVDSLRQKNFRWLLSRQKALESSSETQAWDPTSANAVDRVTEMLMFHRAVGGTQYTRLEDKPLEGLDLSDVLSEDRCMLVGRVAKPMTDLNLTDGQGQGSADSFQPGGRRLTMMRVVLPVDTTGRR